MALIAHLFLALTKLLCLPAPVFIHSPTDGHLGCLLTSFGNYEGIKLLSTPSAGFCVDVNYKLFWANIKQCDYFNHMIRVCFDL